MRDPSKVSNLKNRPIIVLLRPRSEWNSGFIDQRLQQRKPINVSHLNARKIPQNNTGTQKYKGNN